MFCSDPEPRAAGALSEFRSSVLPSALNTVILSSPSKHPCLPHSSLTAQPVWLSQHATEWLRGAPYSSAILLNFPNWLFSHPILHLGFSAGCSLVYSTRCFLVSGRFQAECQGYNGEEKHSELPAAADQHSCRVPSRPLHLPIISCSDSPAAAVSS